MRHRIVMAVLYIIARTLKLQAICTCETCSTNGDSCEVLITTSPTKTSLHAQHSIFRCMSVLRCYMHASTASPPLEDP